MPGKWIRTIEEQGNAYTGSFVSVDLPVSNFIGAVWLRMSGLGGATPVTTNLMAKEVNVQIVADGSKIIYNSTVRLGQQATTYLHGFVPELTTAGAAAATALTLPIIFGRFLTDTDYVLPAKLYKTLQLRVSTEVALGANTDLFSAAGCTNFIVECDQYISSDDPTTKKVIKKVIIESHVNAGAVNGGYILDVPLQGAASRFFLHAYTTATGAAAAIVTAAYARENSSNRVWDGTFADNANFYVSPSTYAATGVNVIDLDKSGNEQNAINLRGLGKFDLTYTEAAVAGTVITYGHFVLNATEV